MPELILGLDVGSTSARALVLDLSGRVLGLLARRDWSTLDRRFSPESVEDELEAELADLARRDGSPSPGERR